MPRLHAVGQSDVLERPGGWARIGDWFECIVACFKVKDALVCALRFCARIVSLGRYAVILESLRGRLDAKPYSKY